MTQLLKMTSCLLGFIVVTACDSRPGPTAPDTSVQFEPARTISVVADQLNHSHEFFDEPTEDTSSGAEDTAENGDACVRSPGFYCQNQDGKNPNMTVGEFEMFAAMAASLLVSIEELGTPEEVAGAVCDTSDQLLRQLAALALNLASGRVERSAPHANADFPTVGDAFDHAVAVASGSLEVTPEERKEVKRMIEQINEVVSIDESEECQAMEDDGDQGAGGTGSVPACTAFDPRNSNKIRICHKAKNTLSISISAWPAHHAHGDTCGPCP